MKTSDLHPPQTGPNADPVLYGVAAGLADLFPPVFATGPKPERQAASERDDERKAGERD